VVGGLSAFFIHDPTQQAVLNALGVNDFSANLNQSVLQVGGVP
jgi:hypothetical protein